MVFFTCNKCGESLKKKDVDKHCSWKCRGGPFLTCVDCLKDFREDYVKHTLCVSENDRYSAKGLNGLSAKPKTKQELWIETVQETVSKAVDGSIPGVTPAMKGLLTFIQDQSTLPDKKKTFINFIKNGRRIESLANVEAVWSILEKARQEMQTRREAERKAEEEAKRKAREEKQKESGNSQDSSSSDSDSDSSGDEKKKKNKNKKEAVSESSQEEGPQENGQKASKKKKRVDSESENNTASNKHKKKRSSDSVSAACDESVSSLANDLQDSVIDEGEEPKQAKVQESDKKLSKKEKKEKKKQEKYAAMLKQVESEQQEHKEEDDDAEANDDEKESEEKSKKKKKNKGEVEQTVEEESTQENGKKKKKDKKNKKRELSESDKQAKAVEEHASKKKSKDTAVNGSSHEICNIENVEPEDTRTEKFSWDKAIMQVLESQDEISVKKLCKKVCSEYLNSLGEGEYVDELKVNSKFHKKLSKMHNVLVHKEKAKLKTSRD